MLSVNLNKVAWLRNARAIGKPDLVDIALMVMESGAKGLTVHPRADARHITLDDVLAIAALPEIQSGAVEFNIEGDLRPELVRLAKAVKATQFTVVPVIPGEMTSSRGWRAYDDQDALKAAVAHFRGVSRVSVFSDATEHSIRLAAAAGVDAVELYTGAYAMAFGLPSADELLAQLEQAAGLARTLGLRVHAGHDLDLNNLPPLLRRVRPDELSIGHAIISEALEKGIRQTVRDYLACIGNS